MEVSDSHRVLYYRLRVLYPINCDRPVTLSLHRVCIHGRLRLCALIILADPATLVQFAYSLLFPREPILRMVDGDNCYTYMGVRFHPLLVHSQPAPASSGMAEDTGFWWQRQETSLLISMREAALTTKEKKSSILEPNVNNSQGTQSQSSPNTVFQ